MTTQIVDLGIPDTADANFLGWADANFQVSQELLEGADPGWAVEFSFNSGLFGVNSIRIGENQSDAGHGAGPDFSTEFENYVNAITLTSASAGSVVIPGPALWTTTDTTEPYTGDLPTDTRTNIGAWLALYNGTDNVTLTLDDGVEPEPRSFTADLGAWSTNDDEWNGSIALPSWLSADGTVKYFRHFDLVGGSVQIEISETADGEISTRGDLNDDWEVYDEAITFDGDGDEIILKGPGSADNTFVDATEPYFWTPDNSSDVNTFLSTTNYSSLTLTFRDGFVPSIESQIQSGVSSGVLSAAGRVRVTGPPPTRIQGSVESGVPSVTSRVRVTAPSPTRIRSAVESGVPVITGRVRLTTPDPLVAPSFADNTGDAQNWTVGTAITSISIPRATGTPDPVYSLITGGPTGINVSLPTTGADGSITGTPTEVGSATIWVRAVNSEGSANWTVVYTTVAAIVPLVITDSDDTGLDVDAKALLVASAPGTVGSDPYADSDRGGTDTPLDGELGLGSTNTVISRFRRLVAAELTLNDNDSPAALDLGAYFNAGGDGNDLTIYLQTLNDGEVSFPVASQFVLGGGNFARFTLPADAQTLLNNIATGDRWIFKAARPLERRIESDVSAGALSVTGRVRVTAPAPTRIRATVESGIPVTAGRVRLTTPAPTRIRGSVDSEVLAVTGRVRVTEPPDLRIRGSVSAGVLIAAGRLRVTEPGESRIQGPVNTGVPAVTGRIRVAPPTRIQSTVTSGVPTVAGAIQVADPPLLLSDLDVPDGRVVLLSALIEVGSSALIYGPDTADGFILDGDDPLDLADQNINISFIRITGGNRFRINDDGTGDFEALFSVGGELESAQVQVQTGADESFILDSSSIFADRSSNSRLEYDLTTAQLATVQGLADSDRFILAIHTPPPDIDIAGAVASGIPVVAGRIRVDAPPMVEERRIRSGVSSGALSASGRIRVTGPPPTRIQGSIDSGALAVTGRVRVTEPPDLRIQGDVSTGVPTVIGRVRTIAPGELRIIGSVRTGIPIVSGQVRTTAPADAQIRAAITSGIFAAMGRVRRTTPDFDLQSFTADLGAWNTGSDEWNGSIALPSWLSADGSVKYLRHFDLVGGSIQIEISETADGEISTRGDLNDDWEVYAEAITLNGDGTEIVLKGPGNPDNTFVDATEPYFWTPDNSADVTTFLNTINYASLTFTFRDGSVDPLESRIHSAVLAGALSVVGRVRIAKPSRIQAAIESGIPVIAGRIRRIDAPPTRIRAAIESGIPIVAGQVRLITPARIRVAVESGVLSTTGRIRFTIPGPLRIRGSVESGVPTVSGRVRFEDPSLVIFPFFKYAADVVVTRSQAIDLTLPRVSNEESGGTYSITNLPAGLTFDPDTLRITGTITGPVGSYTIDLDYVSP